KRGVDCLPVSRRVFRLDERAAGGWTASSSAPAHSSGRPRQSDLCDRCRAEDRVSPDTTRRPFTRRQRSTILSGMLAFVIMLVVLQLWLLSATMNAYLGGDDRVIWPAAAASIVCFLLNAGLLRYLYFIDRARR